MKNSFKPLFVIFIVAILLSVIVQPHGGIRGDIPWRKDLASARAEAKQSHTNVFVEFSAEWCGPCKQMAHTTWSDKAVVAEISKMVPVQIDFDGHHDLADEYGVDGIPAYYVIDPEGTIVKSGGGYRSPSDFLKWLHSKGDVH